MSFSRRKFIQTGVGSAVAVAATAAGAEAIKAAALHAADSQPLLEGVASVGDGSVASNDVNEALNGSFSHAMQSNNLPPSPQSSPISAGQQAYVSPVTWAGPVNVTMAPDRMPEIPADKLTDAQKKASEEFAAERKTPVFGPFIPLLRSPEVMLRTRAMGDYLRYKSVLAPKVSEYAILITARFWSNQYEWALHYPIAVKAGVNPDLLAALAEGRQVKGVYETDQLTYEFCSELLRNKCLSDTTYHWAVLKLGEQAVIDLASLVGYYSMLALVMNMARTPVPKDVKPPLAQFPR